MTIIHKIRDIRNRLFIGFDLSRNRHQRKNNSPYIGSDTVDLFNPLPGVFTTESAFLPLRKTYVNNFAIFIEDFVDVTKQLSLHSPAGMTR